MSASIDSLVVTYNCGRELLNPAILSNHLSHAIPGASPSILVFSLQELAPIAYSFLGGTFVKPYLDRIRATVGLTYKKWGTGHEYEQIAVRHVGMTAIMVFVRQDFSHHVERVDTGGVGVGWYEMGNKGAVAVSLHLKENGSSAGPRALGITFVAAHLAPMECALERRNEDWRNIVENLVLTPLVTGREDYPPKFESDSPAGTADEQQPLLGSDANHTERQYTETSYSGGIYAPHRHVVVAGDLNYRTSNSAPRPSSRAMYPHLFVEESSPRHHRHLLPSDQLSLEIKEQRALHGFEEAPITFAPTYKYSRAAQDAVALLESDSDLKPGNRRDEDGENLESSSSSPAAPLDFPWSSHRWPSWCDRILFLACGEREDSDNNANIRPKKYMSLPLMSTSDHQPVLLHFEIPWSTVPSDKIRTNPPYVTNPRWQSRRANARRLEILTGICAYLGTTWEGAALVFAIVVGGIGGWAAMSHLIP